MIAALPPEQDGVEGLYGEEVLPVGDPAAVLGTLGPGEGGGAQAEPPVCSMEGLGRDRGQGAHHRVAVAKVYICV